MDNVYEKMYDHIFNPILSRFNIPESERPYVIKFYITGIFAVVMEWLKGKRGGHPPRFVLAYPIGF